MARRSANAVVSEVGYVVCILTMDRPKSFT